MKGCEVITIIIMTVITFWTTYIAGKYLWRLHTDINNHKYIDNDLAHSQAHFAITGGILLLSILMFTNSFSWDMKHLFLEHLFFNLFAIFIVLPHIMSEK